MNNKTEFTISLNNIVVYGFHGVHQEEKTLGQRFEIDLEYRLASEMAYTQIGWLMDKLSDCTVMHSSQEQMVGNYS